MRFLAAVSALLWAAAGLPAAAQSGASQAPAGWDADLPLAELPDRNPDPHIVEVDMTARLADVEIAPGKRVHAWTYNGVIPGPLIKARVGDRLIVHFTNQLDEPTTIHWHGLRVPIEMDGVPGVSQPEMKKGDTFTYDLLLRDAGLFWYHPHVMSAAQVGFGLYGALLVEDPDDGVGVADQLTLVLSDIGFDAKGVLEPADSGGPAGMVFGREGAYVLANGRRLPTLKARAGAPQRWRIVNAAKSRFFLLDMDGQPFYRVGGDGGLMERPVTSDTLLVTTGERADVIVTPTGAPGSTLMLRALLYNRGYGSVEYRGVEDVVAIEFSKDPAVKPPPMPKVARAITPPDLKGATPVEMVLSLPPAGPDGNSEYQINGVPYWKATPFHAEVGETQVWDIRNESSYDHPFHLHGFFFMELDEKGEPVRPLEWKDTINVPLKGERRVVVAFDENRPGLWMIHCHILDHAEGGLMGNVQLGPATGTAAHQHPKPPPR